MSKSQAVYSMTFGNDPVPTKNPFEDEIMTKPLNKVKESKPEPVKEPEPAQPDLLPVQLDSDITPKKTVNGQAMVYTSRAFTIMPVDVSQVIPLSRKNEFVERYLVTGDITEERELVNVCSYCGKVSKDELCVECFPYGMCPNCFTALGKDYCCPECTPFGICPVCGIARQVEGACGQLYCQTQVPVIRCVLCNKRMKENGFCSNQECPKSYEVTFICATASCKKYCQAFVQNEDEYSKEAIKNRHAACKLWGLHESLDVSKEVMDFYMLWGLSRVYDDKEATKLLKQQVASLDKEFINYLDLAIGGELRHTLNHNRTYNNKVPNWLKNEFPCRQARPCAWLRWKDVRDEYGLDALQSAVECFMLPGWPNSFGGANWAAIAKTLLDRLEDKISPVIFIDLVWSLEHNCNCALDKIYNVRRLKTALNICFNKKDPLELLHSDMGANISSHVRELAMKYEKA